MSLAGLSSMVTSCTALGGVTGRAAAVVVPNAKGLVVTSAEVVPPGVLLKLNGTGAAGGAVEAVEVPKAKPVVGFFSTLEVTPKEYVVAGFSSVGAVLGRGPNENGVAGGGVPKRGLDASAAGSAVAEVGAGVDGAAGVG